jgi:hypothetical protein
VPGDWLHALYPKYEDSLFSANYRGFLGFGKRRKINTAIRTTAESSASDFWAYNNGITVQKSAGPTLSVRLLPKTINMLRSAQSSSFNVLRCTPQLADFSRALPDAQMSAL